MAGLYQEKLGAENKVDFDDLMLWSIRLLHENPDVRAQAENDHPFLLVDEYQDTNMPQYVLIKQLSEDSRNLFVVGDPDQAIYEWRGASIENIMRFEEDFPGSHRIDLETTYRSTGNILEAAGALIEPNEARIERKLTTTQAPGEPITVHAARTPSEEARYAAGVAKPALEAGESVAVLYRTNAQARAMEDHFKRENVPYEIAGGESFYKRAACETPGACGLAQPSILLVNTHLPWIADWMPLWRTGGTPRGESRAVSTCCRPSVGTPVGD